MQYQLLDLCCRAGGCTKGYQNAGFYVVGVDIEPQPHYIGDEFYQDDMFHFIKTTDLSRFDAIHVSPPCQGYCDLRFMYNAQKHPQLIDSIREQLQKIGKPYIIENVEGAPLRNPIILCGTMFGLGCKNAELWRHRLFEINWPHFLVPPCAHHSRGRVIGVYGGHGRDRRRKVNTQDFTTAERREAMGIDWMTGEELSQAIPPVYTELFGRQLIQNLVQR